MSVLLPYSLTPHICVLSSPDLDNLLATSSLPPLPTVLQSFSPLPQVTTRTTSLSSVTHASFALRFSDLIEIEVACREDEERRAVRTMDWISGRINRRSQKWLEDIDKLDDDDAIRTPWWDELRRCAQGDHVPTKTEGWNHPVAIILAVSTTAPNPLQAVTALHSRLIDFPSWVDPTFLRYTLIVHPHNSPLSNEEAGALYNAVKKQYGLHSYLLSLDMPVPPPPPVPVPTLIPRLPLPHELNSASSPPLLPTSPATISSHAIPDMLHMAEGDIQQTARFAREFLVMSLLPWMEKCVLEWNENFTSTRRLPSRLFSSTRRLFGTPSSTPPPSHYPSSSISSLPSRPASTSTISGQGSVLIPPPSQQRRLAEFLTILGDLKVAISVWEALRKEGKGGYDTLPLLLAPSPVLSTYVVNALGSIGLHSVDPTPHAQTLSLLYAVRWESGIAKPDFFGEILNGERWLVWAAGNAEEAPSALLLAHAALISATKRMRRKAALWYFIAANRLEKCGIKPLTMYFLRKAHGLYKTRPHKPLSPSFWESEGKSPLDLFGNDAIMSGIEHPLGRLLYTTGDVAGAVRFFLGLMRGSSGSHTPNLASPPHSGTISGASKIPGSDKVFLDDFRVAFAHFKSTAGKNAQISDLKLPFMFLVPGRTRIRLRKESDSGEMHIWDRLRDEWNTFWKAQGGKDSLTKSNKPSVDEEFWIDLQLRNPLDTEVNLSNITVTAQVFDNEDLTPPLQDILDIEIINDLILGPNEARIVPIRMKSSGPALLKFSHVTFDFLSLLPSSESLTSRGRRLHDTVLQRQKATYSPDVQISIEVERTDQNLLVEFSDDNDLVLFHGEEITLSLVLSNTGKQSIQEAWLLGDANDGLWIASGASFSKNDVSRLELLRSSNSLVPDQPHRLLIGMESMSALDPECSTEVTVTLHAHTTGEHELCLLVVYRKDASQPFRSCQVSRRLQVQPLLDVSVTARPSFALESSFLVDLEVTNVSPDLSVRLVQIVSLSPGWECQSSVPFQNSSLPALQTFQLPLMATSWSGIDKARPALAYLRQKVGDILYGQVVEPSIPPPVDLCCCHIGHVDNIHSVGTPKTQHFLHCVRRKAISRQLVQFHPHIPTRYHPHIFPLYNYTSVDFAIFWTLPLERHGFTVVQGINLGATHAALKNVIEQAKHNKVKRSLFAETAREKAEVIEAVEVSEWNAEMNPAVISIQNERIMKHDFRNGPCRLSIDLCIRNFSLTNKLRFVLKLSASKSIPSTPDVLPPPFLGRLTFKGTVGPCQNSIVKPKLWITRAGTYSLGGWELETEVLDSDDESHVRHHYLQEPTPDDTECLIVCDSQEIQE